MPAGGVFWPVLFIANVAALIASRTMTTATFSCIKKSIALGCFPHLKIIHTSKKFMGQIYIPVANWFLLFFCVVFIITFSRMAEIGNAYGITKYSTLLMFLYFCYNIKILYTISILCCSCLNIYHVGKTEKLPIVLHKWYSKMLLDL